MLDIDAIKNKLMSLQSELEQRLAKIDEDMKRKDKPLPADFAEQTVVRENDQVIEEIGRVTEIELSEIKDALWRIEQGRYGRCIKCGADIPLERLLAIPMTIYCKDCAY